EAGLGLKFGLSAMGPAMAAIAGPVGIAVGGFTLFAGIVEALNKAIDEQAKLIVEKWEPAVKGMDFKDLASEHERVGRSLADVTAKVDEQKTRLREWSFLVGVFNRDMVTQQE